MSTTNTTTIFGGFVNNEDGRYSKEKPYIYHGPDMGFPQTNLVFKPAPLNSLTDLRNLPVAERPKIETHGFCLIENQSEALKHMNDDTDTQPAYANEMAEVLTDILGATKVVPVHTAVCSLALAKKNKANFTADLSTVAKCEQRSSTCSSRNRGSHG
jgi:hypothetical protein